MNIDHLKTWPKQTFLVERGQIGDCWRCCISAITKIPAVEIPHFVKDSVEGEDHGCSVNATTQKWLNSKGFMLISARQFNFPRFHSDNISFAVIACGPSVRSKAKGQHHAVVMENAGYSDNVLYDPHPSEAGLLAVTEQYMVVPLAR